MAHMSSSGVGLRSAAMSRSGHQPRLVVRPDGRFEVQCPECVAGQRGGGLPIGIGLPVSNRAEAEGIARNHAGLRRRRP